MSTKGPRDSAPRSPSRPVRRASIWVGRLPGTSPTGLPASPSAPGLLGSASLSAICHPPNECLALLPQGNKKRPRLCTAPQAGLFSTVSRSALSRQVYSAARPACQGDVLASNGVDLDRPGGLRG